MFTVVSCGKRASRSFKSACDRDSSPVSASAKAAEYDTSRPVDMSSASAAVRRASATLPTSACHTAGAV